MTMQERLIHVGAEALRLDRENRELKERLQLVSKFYGYADHLHYCPRHRDATALPCSCGLDALRANPLLK